MRHRTPSRLINTPRIELWPASLLRARGNHDARVLSRARTVLRRKRDGRYLAATIAGGVVRLWQTSDWTSVGSVAGQFAFDPGQLAATVLRIAN